MKTDWANTDMEDFELMAKLESEWQTESKREERIHNFSMISKNEKSLQELHEMRIAAADEKAMKIHNMSEEEYFIAVQTALDLKIADELAYIKWLQDYSAK